MHSHSSADAGACRTSAGRVVERKLKRLHLAGDELMPGASETAVKLLMHAGLLFRLHNVKAEEAVSELQAVLERRYDLLVNARADDERVNHRLDRMLFLLIEINVLAKVARLAIDACPAIA